MVRWDDGNNREELSAMWSRIFHDTLPYISFYFDEVYGKNEVLLEECEEGRRGMLHLNPYTLQMGQDLMNAHYIVGVSTEEDYRRQGVMRTLLLEAFRSMRENGEAFTYLMPADENYYLPFSFRFGMKQYCQEIDPGNLNIEDKGYAFYRPAQVALEEFASAENEFKKNHYSISTEVSPAYLERMEKEVRSEFGLFFYCKKEDQPMGRFVAYAEDDFISISQMVCYGEDRLEFIQQILRFLDDRYHFRNYKFTYPEDWAQNLLENGQFDQIRILTTKEQKVIMFRILRLEDMGRWIGSKKASHCVLKVEDKDIEEQSGIYEFTADEDHMQIKRLDSYDGELDGTIDIASLTSRIFGSLEEEGENVPESFDQAAAEFWTELVPLAPIEIPEIV